MDKKYKSRIMRRVNTRDEFTDFIHANKEYWNKIFTQLDTSDTSLLDESQALAEVLPQELYKKVCETLNIPLVANEFEEKDTIKVKLPRRAVKEPQISSRKCLFIDRELDSDTDVEVYTSDEEDEPNIYQQLLSKPIREQVTWNSRYLQPEKEDEKSLVKKADDLTNRIANEFCEYMKQLGGDQQSQLFTPKAIKELFQVEFDTHIARSLRVIPKELPCIDDKIANVTGSPEKSRSATIDRAITSDIKVENQIDIITAFNCSLPKADQRHVPKNKAQKLWRSTEHVPKDLVTLKTVWEGITNLRSVKEYCRWMIEHPEHRRPPYLNSLGLFNPTVLNALLTLEAEYPHSPPRVTSASQHNLAPIEKIHRRLSQLVDTNE